MSKKPVGAAAVITDSDETNGCFIREVKGSIVE
jgi:hypothetical protein